MSQNNGGQAFPVPAGNFSGGESWMPEDGMTLRDYFAGQALAGLLANVTYNQFSGRGGELCGGIATSDAANTAYQMAEAMLAERANAEGSTWNGSDRRSGTGVEHAARDERRGPEGKR